MKGTSRDHPVQLLDYFRAKQVLEYVVEGIVQKQLEHRQTLGINYLTRKPVPVYHTAEGSNIRTPPPFALSAASHQNTSQDLLVQGLKVQLYATMFPGDLNLNPTSVLSPLSNTTLLHIHHDLSACRRPTSHNSLLQLPSLSFQVLWHNLLVAQQHLARGPSLLLC